MVPIRDRQIEQLKKFHKATFNEESILSSAADLKYTNDLRHQISQEFASPTPDFVKHFTRKVYPGVITAKVLDQFTNLTKLSIQQHINDIISERLKVALDTEDKVSKQTDAAQAAALQADPKVVTTEEELEAYMIVKTILRQKVDPSRITYRDAQTYCAILLDDNNRKPICRLYFNGVKKFIVYFEENKQEIKTEIGSLNEIFNLDEKLISVIERWRD